MSAVKGNFKLGRRASQAKIARIVTVRKTLAPAKLEAVAWTTEPPLDQPVTGAESHLEMTKSDPRTSLARTILKMR